MSDASSRADRRELWVPLLALAVLLPFLNKAFSIDDTLFLKLGQHLLEDPFDFYGFDVNWYGTAQPMHTVTKNPPLVGYVLAAAGAVLGWSEVALHLVFLVPALAVAWGTTRLARRFTKRPVTAGLIGVFTPVFLVSSTSVMCDTWLLAFWVGALLYWLRGLEGGRETSDLWIAALLAALAGVTKYFGIALLPLMAAAALLWRGSPRRWLPPLILPLALWTAYELYTASLYDHEGYGLLLDAVVFTGSFRDSSVAPPLLQRTLTGLVFAGGSLLPALWFVPVAWRWRGLLAAGAALGALAAAYSASGQRLHTMDPALVAFEPWVYELQFGILLVSGLSVGALVALDLLRRRDRESVLLACWLGGTFAFATYVNWVNNGRSNLPMAPCLGILIARQLDLASPSRLAVRVAATLSAVTALLVAHGDATWADGVRTTARTIARDHMSPGTTFFQGHWGFQWYMEQAGARAVDLDRDRLFPGDHLVLPFPNTHVFPPPQGLDVVLDLDVGHASPVIVLSRNSGVGFYASELGPMPFLAAPLKPEKYVVGRCRVSLDYRGKLTPHEEIRQGLPAQGDDE